MPGDQFLETVGGWQVVEDPDRWSCTGSMTEEEEYFSLDEGSEPEVDTDGHECAPSVYAQLRERADAPVLFDLLGPNEQEVVEVAHSTLAVYFRFRDGGKREACQYLLRRMMPVAADFWWDVGTDHAVAVAPDGRRCECADPFLVVLVRPRVFVGGRYPVAELSRLAQVVLGCPRLRRGKVHFNLKRAESIVYEVIPQEERDRWVESRRELLRNCNTEGLERAEAVQGMMAGLLRWTDEHVVER